MLVFTLALLACVLHVATAHASVTGYAEPAYTKTSGQNSYWWNWNAPQGYNSNNQPVYNYYLCLGTIHNGITEETAGNPNSGPNNCALQRSTSTPASANVGYQPYTASTVLQDGNTYQMCATGYYYYFYLYSIDNASSGTCPSTTIDRNAPTISTSVDGTAQYTNNPVLALQINYSDPTSPPWFGNNGIASNWTCVNRGAACTPSGNPDPNCSARHYANSRTDYFTCQADATSQPDGTWYFCARSADAALPDNASGPNQLGATSNQANLSAAACGYVTLDRGAPSITAHASAVNVTTGTLINFSTTATDAVSGVGSTFDWDFGDNTPHGASMTPSHTYTQPGTYQAKVTGTDGAGNPGQGTVTITVNPPSGGGGGTPQTPGTTQGTSGATPSSNVGANTISQQAGGGGAVTSTIGGLSIIAPKKFTIGKKQLLLALTPNTAGTAKVALLKSSKVVSRASAKLGGAGTYALKLRVPKKLKAGTYKLQVTFIPAGSTHGKTKTLRVKVVKKGGKKAHKIAARLAIRELRGAHTTAGKPSGIGPRGPHTTAIR